MNPWFFPAIFSVAFFILELTTICIGKHNLNLKIIATWQQRYYSPSVYYFIIITTPIQQILGKQKDHMQLKYQIQSKQKFCTGK